MSHRPQDTYPYVATQVIRNGMVTAFNEGDPVPESTVEELGLLDAGLVVPADEWDGPAEDKPQQAMKRGEMPPHLKNTGGTESATAKTVKSGGASTRKPEPAKSDTTKSADKG